MAPAGVHIEVGNSGVKPADHVRRDWELGTGHYWQSTARNASPCLK